MKQRRNPLKLAAAVALTAALASACSATTDNAGPTSTTLGATTIPVNAPTLPSGGSAVPGSGAAQIDDNTGQIVGATDLELLNSAITAVPETLPTTTVPLGTTTTIPHGAGITLETNDGDPLKDVVSTTAKEIYQAAISRDYTKIETIIGDRRFRWGFIGQRGPAAQWRTDYAEGRDDQIKRIIRLLETKPLVDERGNTVWPYLALKDPIDWSAEDDALAATLGFQPENIADTKLKGKYLDYRLVVDAQGIWTGLYLGN
jgi:hypothetical protein